MPTYRAEEVLRTRNRAAQVKRKWEQIVSRGFSELALPSSLALNNRNS